MERTQTAAGEVTRILREWHAGDRDAERELWPIVYDELRTLARLTLRRGGDAGAQSTSLVHEAYLRLVGQPGAGWNDRGHFFAVAAKAMRQILVDRARRRTTLKRGPEDRGIPLDDVAEIAGPAGGDLLAGREVDLIALDDALDRLTSSRPRAAKLVELRFFAGLTVEEAAVVLGVSEATAARDWRATRVWLYSELKT